MALPRFGFPQYLTRNSRFPRVTQNLFPRNPNRACTSHSRPNERRISLFAISQHNGAHCSRELFRPRHTSHKACTSHSGVDCPCHHTKGKRHNEHRRRRGNWGVCRNGANPCCARIRAHDSEGNPVFLMMNACAQPVSQTPLRLRAQRFRVSVQWYPRGRRTHGPPARCNEFPTAGHLCFRRGCETENSKIASDDVPHKLPSGSPNNSYLKAIYSFASRFGLK